MILVESTSRERLEIGNTLVSFRGEHVKLIGWREPHKAGSTGRVQVEFADGKIGEYFPTVFNAEFVHEGVKDMPRANKAKRYHFDLICPECGKHSETVANIRIPPPHVNCGDCLMNQVFISEMRVVRVTESDQ